MGGSDNTRVQRAVERALDKFWEEIGRAYPEITTGDLDPGSAITMSDAAEEVVENWVRWNAPDADDEDPMHRYRITIAEKVVRFTTVEVEARSEGLALHSVLDPLQTGTVQQAPDLSGVVYVGDEVRDIESTHVQVIE